MIIQSPITFDDGSTFAPDGQFHRWSQKSGYDGIGRRITNLVGHDGSHFIKHCPYCDQELPETDFGYVGRDTGEPVRRDQSNCNKCRNRYR